MATCDLWTNQVGNSYCPQVHFEVWITSQNATTVYYDWYMYYVTYGYAAYTNGYSRSVTANVGGNTHSGSININGVTGTQKINSGSSSLTKTHASQKISCSVSMYFDVTWNGTYAEYVSKSGSFTIGAKTSYTVSYNANGGSGAPSNQTKWHGENLTLSTTKPTRTGYSFKNWNTKADGSGTTYASGGGYTGNAALTLYAQWTANTYTVKYDANGGTGAPANQTKTYGVDLTLSTTKPTRTNYNFLGWSTSSTATSAQYVSGGKYTANSAVTLYAVWELAYWKPKITNLSAARCTSDGTADDFNTYAKVTFKYELCQLIGENTPQTITIGYKLPTATSYTNTTVTATATSGTISQVIGGSLDINNSYDILVTVTDTKDGSTSLTTSIGSSVFPIDILKDNKGIAFGKAAEEAMFVDSAWRFRTSANGVTNVFGSRNANWCHYETTAPQHWFNKPVAIQGRIYGGDSYNRSVGYYDQGGTSYWGMMTPQENDTDYIRTTESGLIPYNAAANDGASALGTAAWPFKNIYGINVYKKGGPVYGEHVLYNNTSGTTGTVTLSQTAANFTYLEIFYVDNNGYERQSKRVYSPDGTRVCLYSIEPTTASSMFFRSTTYTISGTSLKPYTDAYGYIAIYGASNIQFSWKTNYIKIIRVIGYK